MDLGLVRLDDRTRCPAAVGVTRVELDLGAWVNTIRQEAELGRGQIVLGRGCAVQSGSSKLVMAPEHVYESVQRTLSPSLHSTV
jgi:hypothetical protein